MELGPGFITCSKTGGARLQGVNGERDQGRSWGGVMKGTPIGAGEGGGVISQTNGEGKNSELSGTGEGATGDWHLDKSVLPWHPPPTVLGAPSHNREGVKPRACWEGGIKEWGETQQVENFKYYLQMKSLLNSFDHPLWPFLHMSTQATQRHI